MKSFNVRLVAFWLLVSAVGGLLYVYLQPTPSTTGLSTVACFAGMIALGAVIMTCRATWMTKLKEAYESEEHLGNANELRKRGHPVKYYGGYERLTGALFTLSMLAWLSALIQLLGTIQWCFLEGFRLGSTLGTLLIFGYLMYRLSRVEKHWIKKIEQDQEAKQNGSEVQMQGIGR